MPKQHNSIEFLCFTTPDYSRVVKVDMAELHTIVQGYQRIVDPAFMSHQNTIIPESKALEIYNKFAKRKLKNFKNKKDCQIKLWNLFNKMAVKPEESDMSRSKVFKVDRSKPKPDPLCKVISARDPYDTSQKLTRTNKMPMASKNIERMKQYENIKTIQDVLDKGVLDIRAIKYDIKLGYVTKG